MENKKASTIKKSELKQIISEEYKRALLKKRLNERTKQINEELKKMDAEDKNLLSEVKADGKDTVNGGIRTPEQDYKWKPEFQKKGSHLLEDEDGDENDNDESDNNDTEGEFQKKLGKIGKKIDKEISSLKDEDDEEEIEIEELSENGENTHGHIENTKGDAVEVMPGEEVSGLEGSEKTNIKENSENTSGHIEVQDGKSVIQVQKQNNSSKPFDTKDSLVKESTNEGSSYSVNGTYGSLHTPATVYVYEVGGGKKWYVVDGSTNVNCTYDEIKEGVNVETLKDIDMFTAKPINNEEELEMAVGKIDEGTIEERWKGSPKIHKTGEYANKTIEQLKDIASALHNKKDHTTAETEKLRQVNFAIRAKQKDRFGSIKKENTNTSINERKQVKMEVARPVKKENLLMEGLAFEKKTALLEELKRINRLAKEDNFDVE